MTWKASQERLLEEACDAIRGAPVSIYPGETYAMNGPQCHLAGLGTECQLWSKMPLRFAGGEHI